MLVTSEVMFCQCALGGLRPKLGPPSQSCAPPHTEAARLQLLSQSLICRAASTNSTSEGRGQPPLRGEPH